MHIFATYCHILPVTSVSYKACGKFTDEDATRLDELKDMLFKCFEEQSVINACKQFQMAKVRKEPCPFSQSELDNMFAKEK